MSAVRFLSRVEVPMRDGVHLSTDIYLPDESGPHPTILFRTPYDNNRPDLVERARALAGRGYACAVQDCRGRFDSDGVYDPFINEAADGYDTQGWIGRQDWSTGRIGMGGGSYDGWVQWSSATLASPHLGCIVPRVMATDLYDGLVYPGGALQLGVLMTWGMATSGRTMQNIDFDDWRDAFRILPLSDADRAAGRDLAHWRDWLAHPTRDAYWDGFDLEAHFDRISVPSLILSGWYDLYAPLAFRSFAALRGRAASPIARAPQLVVGPWPHALSTSPRTGEVDFGADSQLDLDAAELRWFDRWLRDEPNGADAQRPLKLFVMGTNLWREEDDWPLERTDPQRWYLHSGGRANAFLGDGALSQEAPWEEPPDHFIYEPDAPVPTNGGNTCCRPYILPWGPRDQRDVEARQDVLCYTSAPLAADLEVTGPVTLTLHAETDRPDTDWTAKLVDVRPSGSAINLCDGILRARYRESTANPTLLEPGRIYRYDIEVGVTANVFRRGHRIRLEISSSNFPRFDRNLNVADPPGVARSGWPARQTVHHARAHPSHLRLPVIPG